MVDVLIWGDTERSPALRHEVPLAIGDAFLYLETDGRRAVLTNALEDERIAQAAPDVERLLGDELGLDELIESGLSREEIARELSFRAVQRLQIRRAAVPSEFPLALADRLRAEEIELQVDDQLFEMRRRRKSETEMAGIRRASEAALAAMKRAAELVREADIAGDELRLGDRILTAEELRKAIRETCARAGASCPPDIIVKSAGPGAPIGHDPGSGPLHPHTPIEIDLWPRDERSGCWADMTRTFVRGEISDGLAALHEAVLEAHERACAAVRPGVRGVDLYNIACEVLERAGQPTQRTKPPGQTLRHGFYFSLGHGVGLEVHEAPALGRTGHQELVAGDVLAIEPGTVDLALGSTRVEDLLAVTDQGGERLTESFPYGLEPLGG
jgi:Xaa-Pro aminopeptidase